MLKRGLGIGSLVIFTALLFMLPKGKALAANPSSLNGNWACQGQFVFGYGSYSPYEVAPTASYVWNMQLTIGSKGVTGTAILGSGIVCDFTILGGTSSLGTSGRGSLTLPFDTYVWDEGDEFLCSEYFYLPEYYAILNLHTLSAQGGQKFYFTQMDPAFSYTEPEDYTDGYPEFNGVCELQ